MYLILNFLKIQMENLNQNTSTLTKSRKSAILQTLCGTIWQWERLKTFTTFKDHTKNNVHNLSIFLFLLRCQKMFVVFAEPHIYNQGKFTQQQNLANQSQEPESLELFKFCPCITHFGLPSVCPFSLYLIPHPPLTLLKGLLAVAVPLLCIHRQSWTLSPCLCSQRSK